MENKTDSSNRWQSRVLCNLRRIVSSPPKAVKFTAFESLSFRNIANRNADILPEQLQCLKLHKSSSIETLFNQGKNHALIFGDVSIVKFSLENDVSFYLGILLSSGMLYLYEYDHQNKKILYFRIVINVRGAIVNLSNEGIIIQSNIQIVIKVHDKLTIEAWHQKLCEAATNIELTNRPVEDRDFGSVKIRRKIDRSFSASFKSQVQYMKTAWKLPDSMKQISRHSWQVENGRLSSLVNHHDDPQTHPTASNEPYAIDSNFKISSIVLARVCAANNRSSKEPFVEAKACLTQDVFTVTMKECAISVAMVECQLETVENLKWGIRAKSPLYKIDIELKSKLSYEKWTIALMKTVSFHCKSGCSQTVSIGSTDMSIHIRNSRSNFPAKTVKLERCLSCPIAISDLNYKDERITKSEIILTDDIADYIQRPTMTHEDIPVDDTSINSIASSGPRLYPQRKSSCLNFPIPILPDFHSSKSFVGSRDSINLEKIRIYDDMESVCCDFERHLKNDKSLTPLPIRCKKHGIATRLKKSCQQFTRKLIKSTDLGKNHKSSLNVVSGRFKSEINLESNESKLLRSKGKGKWGISQSVSDVRVSKCDVFARKHSAVETIVDDCEYDEDSCEYEEPVCAQPMSI